MEENSETKDLEQVKKTTVDIGIYKEQFNELVVDGETSIEDAESLKKQVKAAKSQANAATELEWRRKKKAWDDSKVDTKKKKVEYEAIRDTRNALLDACTYIINGIKKKIEDFRSECVRKAEEERRAKKAAELKAKEAEEERIAAELKAKEKAEENNRKRIAAESKACEKEARRKIEEEECGRQAKIRESVNKPVCETCGGLGKVTDPYLGNLTCPTCQGDSVSTNKDPGQINDTETTKPDATIPPQKSEEGENEAVVEEIDVLNANVCDAICGDLENFELVTTNIVDEWRHGTEKIAIVRSKSSKKLYKSNFRDSCKDEMSFDDMNDTNANFFEIQKEIEIEVTDMKAFIRSVMFGERGATLDLIQPNVEAIIKLAQKHDCKPGDIIIAGCRVKG